VIIAPGASIVAIGVGADAKVDAAIVLAAAIGTAVAATQWWLYFDVVFNVAARRLGDLEVGREQNEMARDSYSYLHFPDDRGDRDGESRRRVRHSVSHEPEEET